MTIASSEPLPDMDKYGYSASTAIIEVLIDARLFDDERLGESEREEIRPGMRGYSIYIDESDRKGSWFGGDSRP